MLEMKLRLIFFSIIVLQLKLFAQYYSVQGNVADNSNKKTLEGASVTLTGQRGKQAGGMAAAKEGKFYFDHLLPGRYTLAVGFIGYINFKKEIEIKNKSLNLQTIYLTPTDVKLKPVEVIGQPTMVVLKSDTTEYNAGAFKTNKDAVAQDLLTKMPGIIVQNGTVQAQGENVAKVLVDGREFFGSDPNAVLKNLPAEVIEKIQVFDQQSEQSQFTGFDDGNTSKTINIVTRLNNRQGTFGKFSAGYGDDSRYAAGGNINFFNKDQRISVIAQLNNVNQQNFSTDDLLGIMSGPGRNFNRAIGGGMGGPGGGRRGGFGAGPGGFGGGNISNFLVSQTAGLTQTKAFGINYSDRWGEKVDITGSYFFNYTNNDAESASNTDYFLTAPSQQNYNETNSSITDNTNHRVNLRLNYQIDEDNSILFFPSFTAQINDGSSNIAGITTSGTDKLNSTNNIFNSDLTALNSSNNLLFRHRFNTPGRTLSIDVNGTFTRNTGGNSLFAKNNYYTSFTSDTVDQASDLLKHGFSGSSNIVYTEPINSNSILQFNTKFYYSEDNSDQKTFDNSIPGSSLLDTSLSNVYKKIYKTQSLGAGYRFRENNLSLALNLNYNLSQLSNSQAFPGADIMQRSFRSLLPSFFLRYMVSRSNNLRISYFASNDDPSIDQLQNVLNNSNQTQLSIGNPNLSQDYKHSLVLRYIQTNGSRMNSLFILFGGTVIRNYIGNTTIIAQKDTVVLNNILLNQGTKLTYPTNLNGYLNLRSFIVYGFPVEFLKSNLNLHVSANYSRTPGIINGIFNYANSSTLGLGLVLGSNISDKVDFTISSISSYNLVKNSTQTDNSSNNNYFSQNSSVRFYWRFWEGFVFQNELNDQYNGNLPSNYKPNTVIWNMSIGMKVLKNDNGEIRFSANDVLNQNTNIQHNVSDSYIQDVRTNVLGRYYLLSFVYNIRAF